MAEGTDEDHETSREEPSGEAPNDEATDAVDEVERRKRAEDAFAAMTPQEWRSRFRDLTAMALALTSSAKDAPDLAHEALALAVEHRRKWVPQRGKLLTFLGVVVRTLVFRHSELSITKHDEVAPESERAGQVAHACSDAREDLVAREERDDSHERFAEVTARVEHDPKAMGIIRCTQHGLCEVKEQAEKLGLSATLVHNARRRLARAIRVVYARYPEARRLAVRSRGVPAKARRANEEGERSVSAPPKLGPKETLDALWQMAEEEEELDRIEAMSDKEVERYLVDQGVDLKAIDVHAEAIYEAVHAPRIVPTTVTELSSARVPGAPRPIDAGRNPVRPPAPLALWLVAAAMAALGIAGGVAVAGLFHEGEPKHATPEPRDSTTVPPPAPPETSPQNRATAVAFRREAGEACVAKDWQLCLEKLNAALDKDPAGDQAGDVQTLRDAANEGLQRLNDKTLPAGGGN